MGTLSPLVGRLHGHGNEHGNPLKGMGFSQPQALLELYVLQKVCRLDGGIIASFREVGNRDFSPLPERPTLQLIGPRQTR